MSTQFKDILQGLLEAISIDKNYSQEEIYEKLRKTLRQSIEQDIYDKLSTIFSDTPNDHTIKEK